MTTVIFQQNKEQEYQAILCMGHAGFAKRHFFRREPDILCAAISVLVINTLNSLEELAHESMEVTTNEETGFIRCIFTKKLQEKSVFLVDSLVYGLKNLEQEYGNQYIKVEFEEV